MANHTAFIDEWGNNVLDFSSKNPVASTHFIVAALTLAKEDLPELKRVVLAVQNRYFKGAFLNSDEVGADSTLRKQILEDLSEAPFQIFGLVVDKRQLIGEGLRYQGSFYKFLHGLADRELFTIFPNLDMVAGNITDESFMKGFIRYVPQHHITNLFNEATFGFVSDQNEMIVRAANFMAGTLARCYDETVISDHRQEFSELLQPRLLMLKFWPDIATVNPVKASIQDQHYDHQLAELSIDLANGFLQRNAQNLIPNVIDQVTTLSYLVFHFRHINAVRYISSFEIMQHIKARRSKPVSLHYFQTKVIAPLRDAGVLIASSSKGYKLPASQSDLYDFVNHSNAIIEPMLSRVKKFRDQIRLATNGELDVLDKQEYSLIRKVVD